MSTNGRNYREEFNAAIRDQLRAIERAMAVYNDHADHLEQRLDELQENDAELKRLILEQGVELRALRQRLEGGA